MEHGRNHRRPRGDWHNQETNTSSSLLQQLQACKEEILYQKDLKKLFINRGRATREELERLKRASDPETMMIFRAATAARSTMKLKSKKVLQMEYENLKTSYVILEKKFSVELQLEREKNKALLDELEHLKLQLKTIQINKEDFNLKGKLLKFQKEATKLHAEEVSQAPRTQPKAEQEDNISEKEALQSSTSTP